MSRFGAFLVGCGIVIFGCGCATYSTVMVNSAGEMRRCSSTGQGVIGMAVAANAVCSCENDLAAMGYLRLDEAGIIGVTFSQASEAPVVLKVNEGSPADSMGIAPGDTIRTVDGTRVTTWKDAKALLFGKAGTPVRVGYGRDGAIHEAAAHRVARAEQQDSWR